MRLWKLYLSVAVALAILGGAAMVVDQLYLRPDTRSSSIGVAAIGGPFKLVDASGKTVTEQDYLGKWLLVYFGYTHCPDVCPTTLADVSAALDQLPPADRAKVKALFITVDPERDTPKVMADYVAGFGNDLDRAQRQPGRDRRGDEGLPGLRQEAPGEGRRLLDGPQLHRLRDGPRRPLRHQLLVRHAAGDHGQEARGPRLLSPGPGS